MNNRIKKYIFITSLGRTGTTFISELLSKVDDIASYHEPGMFNINKPFSKKNIKRLKQFGPKMFFYNKIILKRDFRYLSNLYIGKKLSTEDATKKILNIRKQFIEKQYQKIYSESNYHYYGLIKPLQLAYKNLKVAYIVRNPKNQILSWMNKINGAYSKGDINLYVKKRLTPKMVSDKNYITRWSSMGQFKKLAWSWNYINTYNFNLFKNSSKVKIFKFEDLFESAERVKNFNSFLNFLLDNKKDYTQLIEKNINHKVNPHPLKKYKNPQFWDKKNSKILYDICGELMLKLGYGEEEE